MAISLPQLDPNEKTFGDWLARTNEISSILESSVPIANNTVSENFTIDGWIDLNELYVNEIHGGDFGNTAPVVFKTEATFEELATFSRIDVNSIKVTNGYNMTCFVDNLGNIENINNSYSGSSDKRIKRDITSANSQWEDIKKLKIKNYRLKEEVKRNKDAKTLLGVIAQDLESTGMENLVFENENGIKSVKYSVLYLKAVKALQEAMTRIEKLEKQVNKLSGKS